MVVPEVKHAAAQLGSLGFANVMSNVVCQTVFAILVLQKLLSVVSKFFSLTLGFPDMVFWFDSFPLIGNFPL